MLGLLNVDTLKCHSIIFNPRAKQSSTYILSLKPSYVTLQGPQQIERFIIRRVSKDFESYEMRKRRGVAESVEDEKLRVGGQVTLSLRRKV